MRIDHSLSPIHDQSSALPPVPYRGVLYVVAKARKEDARLADWIRFSFSPTMTSVRMSFDRLTKMLKARDSA